MGVLKFGCQAAHLFKQTQIRDQQFHVLIASRLLDFGLRRLAFRTAAAHQHHGCVSVGQFSGRDFADTRSAPCH